MRLRRLRLENYRMYHDAEVEFPDGIIGIVGRNGAGKSTLIEAIAWCLYGGHAARTNQDEIITSNAPPGTACTVTLDAEVGGEALTIVREARKGRTAVSARVFSQGRANASVTGGHEVTNYMARRMGMDRVAFFSSVFAQQKELAGLSRMKDSERKKTVLRLLGIDTVEKALTLIKSDSRDLGQKIDAHRSVARDELGIRGELADLKDRRKTAAKAAVGARAAAGDLGRALKAAKEEQVRLEDMKGRDRAHRASLEKAHAVCESKRADLAEKEAELEDLRRDKRKLESLRPSVHMYSQAKKTLVKMDMDAAKHAEKAAAEDALARTEGQLKALQKANIDASKKLGSARSSSPDEGVTRREISSLQAELDGTRETRAAADAESAKAAADARDLRKELDEIESLKTLSKCPRCRRPLGDSFSTLVVSTEREIRALKEIVAARQESSKSLGEKIESIESSMEEACAVLERCQEAQKEIASLEAGIDSNDRQMDMLRADIRSATRKAKKLAGVSYDGDAHERAREEAGQLEASRNEALALEERAGRMPSVRAKIKDLKEAIRALEAEIKAENEAIADIAFDEGAHADSEAALDAAQDAYHAARENAIELEGSLKEADAEIRAKKSELEEAMKSASAVRSLEGRAEALGRLQGHMDGFKTNLISRIRPALRSRTSDLLNLTTGGKYPAVEFDDSYAIRIASGGGKFALDRFSGGEQDLVSLCLRIAISKELSERAGYAGSNFIALDEVFGSQDVERKSAILNALAGVSGEFGQVLLITHIEDIREALPYALHVIEGKEGSSRIEVESRLAGPAAGGAGLRDGGAGETGQHE